MAAGAERLQKYLARSGLGSRRYCEDLIRAGRVTVDGLVAQLGSSVDPNVQRVAVDGREVSREPPEYWVLNKPRGVVSTAWDPRGRPTVVESVPARGRVFPVGRLDLDSTGIIILTNDGELTSRLLHPRHHVEKEYVVTVRGSVSTSDLGRLSHGVELEDGLTSPARVDVMGRVDSPPKAPMTMLRIVLQEGRKRQIRRMLESLGHRVVSLHRTRFDGLSDEGLAVGQVRPLSHSEVKCLKEAARYTLVDSTPE